MSGAVTHGMTWGRYYWPFFLILVSNLFAWPEGIAIFSNHANTLSDYSWYELHVTGHMTMHTIAWYVSLTAWLLFVIVITLHIWWRYAG